MRYQVAVIAGVLLPWCLSLGQTQAPHDSLAAQSAHRDTARAPMEKNPQQPAGRASTTYGLEIPPGIIFGKFEKENGPFLLQGSVIVPSGEVLEFGPGCTIFMGGNYPTITVFGQLIVKGTAAQPVIFQSANPKPNPWDWDRIYCRSRNRSVFEHCIIRHSNYGIYVENGSVS
ncbi:MAG TPA: hypothetical protein VF335_08310, partial [Chitinivibrionales bacterium]